MVFILCVSNCFQITCFKVSSKISPRFQWFSNCVFQECFQIMSSKCFQNSPYVSMVFNVSIMCFKVFSKISHKVSSGFQIVCLNEFKVFSKICHRFQ